jgi:molybdopterin/thiamine biosynthesis adenylyltransferase
VADLNLSLALLSEGKVPERYQRNIGTIGISGQARLLKSKVAVIGVGGLGGTVIELLVRMGIGEIVVIDGDVFSSHNLNRQLLSTEKNLGMFKTAAAIERAGRVNTDVKITAVAEMLTEANADTLLEGAEVVVDALDSIKTRLLLCAVCQRKGIPVVHAAIAGFTGQITTIFPQDKGLDQLYKLTAGTEKGVEVMLGNPAATPAMAASIQAHEVVKILTGIGEPLRGKLLYFDAELNIYEQLDIS